MSPADYSPKVRADDGRYRILDLELPGATVSVTILHPGQQTKGHKHEHEEVYLFLVGKADVALGNKYTSFAPGSFVVVEPNEFHRVYNWTKEDIIFLCAWSNDAKSK